MGLASGFDWVARTLWRRGLAPFSSLGTEVLDRAGGR